MSTRRLWAAARAIATVLRARAGRLRSRRCHIGERFVAHAPANLLRRSRRPAPARKYADHRACWRSTMIRSRVWLTQCDVDRWDYWHDGAAGAGPRITRRPRTPSTNRIAIIDETLARAVRQEGQPDRPARAVAYGSSSHRNGGGARRRRAEPPSGSRTKCGRILHAGRPGSAHRAVSAAHVGPDGGGRGVLPDIRRTMAIDEQLPIIDQPGRYTRSDFVLWVLRAGAQIFLAFGLLALFMSVVGVWRQVVCGRASHARLVSTCARRDTARGRRHDRARFTTTVISWWPASHVGGGRVSDPRSWATAPSRPSWWRCWRSPARQRRRRGCRRDGPRAADAALRSE